MNLLLLPGNGKRSLEWIPSVEQALAPSFEQTVVVTYRHWETGKSEIDLEREAARLSEKAKILEPYAVFAKSAGSMVTAVAIANEQLQPKWCLFAGLPLVMINDHQLAANEWLSKATMPIIVVQNDADPYGSFQDVRDYLSRSKQSNITVVEAPGNSHDYDDLALMKRLAKQLSEHNA